MGVALAAVADDRHRLAGQGRGVSIVVVVHPCGHVGSLLVDLST